MISKILTLMTAGLCLIAAPAEAKEKSKGKGKSGGNKPSSAEKGKPSKGKKDQKGNGSKKGPDKEKGASNSTDKAHKDLSKASKDWHKAGKFESADRDQIHSHWKRYEKNARGLPPGLAKKVRKGGDLPPGWQKKLRHGWKIDDNDWRFFEPVGADYLPKGMHLPPDTGVYLFGDRMVRVHRPSREVVDFMTIPGITD